MKKTKRLFWLRLVSVLIDLSVIYSLATLLKAMIWKFVFADFAVIFIATLILYYFFSYLLLKGQTLSKLLTGTGVVKKNEETLTLTNILLREGLLKGIIGLIIPAYLLPLFFPLWSVFFTALVYMVMLLLSLITMLILKRPWWEMLSKTRTIKVSGISKASLRSSFIAVTVLVFTSLYITTAPFLTGHDQIITSLPAEYPAGRETERYADFVKKHAQDPADYIFELFKKYDIVVISERMHTEYTQYELISKIVQDDRFIKNAGNIFTECGSVSFQDTLNTYLHSTYNTDEQLNRATANLQRNSNALWALWDNTNLFDLFKTVNRLNNTLPDSTKLNWYFTDMPVNWETMTPEKRRAAFNDPTRDSMMAVHIIEKYNHIIAGQQRKKALVIMNTRHGYGLQRARQGKKLRLRDDNTTAYLMEAMPGKVANVMMNTASMKYGFMYTPVQQGKWETVFSGLGNPAAGFDLAGSPFGDDPFDLAVFNVPGLKYKDVFTGFIFYKPLSQQYEKNGFPFEYDNFEDTILRRASCISKSYAEGFKNGIVNHKLHPQEDSFSRPVKYGILYNLVNVVITPVLILVVYLFGLAFFIKRKKMIRRNDYQAAD